jgi:hypothetical protein
VLPLLSIFSLEYLLGAVVDCAAGANLRRPDAGDHACTTAMDPGPAEAVLGTRQWLGDLLFYYMDKQS